MYARLNCPCAGCATAAAARWRRAEGCGWRRCNEITQQHRAGCASVRWQGQGARAPSRSSLPTSLLRAWHTAAASRRRRHRCCTRCGWHMLRCAAGRSCGAAGQLNAAPAVCMARRSGRSWVGGKHQGGGKGPAKRGPGLSTSMMAGGVRGWHRQWPKHSPPGRRGRVSSLPARTYENPACRPLGQRCGVCCDWCDRLQWFEGAGVAGAGSEGWHGCPPGAATLASLAAA